MKRPGIDITVDRDISLFKQIVALLSTTNFGKRYNIVSLAEEFSTSLQNELDFTLEATYSDQFRHNLSQGKWFDAQPPQFRNPAH